jgi:hypothetical protein
VAGEPFRSDDLLSQTKNRYSPGLTEAAVLEVWRETHGDELPSAHLDFAELSALVKGGWTVANHTRSHPTLAALPPERLDDEILGNQLELEAAGLEPLLWLAYPNGASWHLSADVGTWLDAHPELMGAHANGGVNLEPSRTEWLRIPIGDEPVSTLRWRLREAVEATRWMLARRAGSTFSVAER